MSIQSLSVPFFLSDTEVNKLQSIVDHPRWAVLATYFHAGFLLGLFIDPEDRGNMFCQCQFTFSRLHSVIPQKVELFIYNMFSKICFL
jgi:hypothetical protein